MQDRVQFPSQLARAAYCSIVFLVYASSVPMARGDGLPEQQKSARQRPTTRQYNERLPPVMPGEEIITETGQKIKTWSSSGPVPVNRRTPPQPIGNTAGPGGIGIIVDDRNRFGHEPAPSGERRGYRAPEQRR